MHEFEQGETNVSSVQYFGHYSTWPSNVRYVGMPGKASRAFGIPDKKAIFGKPWHLLDDPRGWATAYVEYLVKRLASDIEFEGRVRLLHGSMLLCYCTKKQADRGVEVQCHARILAEFVELLYHQGE